MNTFPTNPLLWGIPSIDGSSQPLNPHLIVQNERAKLDKILNAPSDISGRSLLGKIIVAGVIGALMSLALVGIMSAVGLTVQSSAATGTGVGMVREIHPLAWLIMLFLGLIITAGGSQILSLVFGALYSEKYHQQSKMSGLLLLTNSVLFAMMIGLFAVMQDVTGAPIVLFALYISVALFLSFAQIEFVVNPNYSASSLVGCTIGFGLSLIVLGLLRKSTYNGIESESQYLLMWIAPLVTFPLMVFGQGLWEILYHKMYETWANPFYLPSQAELDTQTIIENQRKEAEKEHINVDL